MITHEQTRSDTYDGAGGRMRAVRGTKTRRHSSDRAGAVSCLKLRREDFPDYFSKMYLIKHCCWATRKYKSTERNLESSYSVSSVFL